MERFDISQLNPGEELLVQTETGSIYRLKAEVTPECLSEAGNLFRGFRASRESDHQIEGRPELIEDEPAHLIIRSGRSDCILRAGDAMELIWDREHPESKSSWDIQFGPKFHPLTTSRIVDIDFVPTRQ